MKLREIMRKICAVLTVLALVGGYLCGEICVKADSDTARTASPKTIISGDVSKKSEETGGKKKNYIVKFKTKKALNTIRENYSESEERNNNSKEKLEDNKIVPLELSGKQAGKLEVDKEVEFIEEDNVVTASARGENEKCVYKKDKSKHVKREKRMKKNNSSVEWNVRMIKAGKAEKSGENKIKVAILDSGIDWGNDIDLAYQISLVPGEEEMTQIFMDGNGHGSSVASLIAARDDGDGITGINPNVDIYSYRVLDDGNEAPLSRVIEAIYMAIDQKVNIINMSFGLNEYSEALERAVQDAEKAGILVIAAAGNTGDDGVQYPAAYEDVMAVGAVNKYGTVEAYSSKGPEVEIVAPGELVRTTGFIGSEEVASGTSLAAPQITAVASLIWQKDPKMPAEFVRGLLDESANLYGKKDAYGNGLVDAEYALAHYDEYKKKYEKRTQAGKKATKSRKQFIPENKSKITTFSDTGCVEGCWKADDHEALVDSSKYCVRAGARFPDLTGNKKFTYDGRTYIYKMGEETNASDTRKFAGMTKNPWWHGYYETNYIKAAIYATRMGDAIVQYDDYKKASNSINYNHAGAMQESITKLYENDTKNGINEKGWKYALWYMKSRNPNNSGAQSQKNTKGFKRAFLWGMAIHTATDTYAHSAEIRGNRIKHIDAWASADNKEYRSWRYQNAASIARQMMSRYNNKQGLATCDLVMPGNKTIGYKLINYAEYISQVDANITGYTYTYGSK